MKIPNHILVASVGGLSRMVAVATQLLCIPLLTSSLETAEFAAYAVTTSLMTWYLLADFGLGNTTQNRIAEATAREDHEAVGQYITTLSVVSLFLVVVAAILLLPFSALLSPEIFSGMNLLHTGNLVRMIWLSGVLFVGAAIGMMANKALFAMRKGVAANIMTMLNSLGFLLLLWLWASRADVADRLFFCVMAYAAPMGINGLLVTSAIAYRFGSRRLGQVWPSLQGMLRLSSRFWLFALLSAAVLNVDYLIMSQLLQAEDIVTYNLMSRIFMVALGLYSAFLSALWPVFSEMGVKGQEREMWRYIHRYASGGVLMMAGLGLGLCWLMPYVLATLAPGHSVQVSMLTIALFSSYIAVRVWTDTHAVALQALGEVSIFLRVVPAQAVVSIGLQVLLAHWWGVNGILAGLVFSFLATVVWFLPRSLRRYWADRGAGLEAS